MKRGGRRENAGRRPSEPTKQVRIPVSMASAVRQLGAFFMGEAQSKLEESTWFKTCPNPSLISLAMVGVEQRRSVKWIGLAPVLVFKASCDVVDEEAEVVIELFQKTQNEYSQ